MSRVDVLHAAAMPALVILTLVLVGRVEQFGRPASEPAAEQTPQVSWESLDVSSAEREAWERLGKNPADVHTANQVTFSYEFTVARIAGLVGLLIGLPLYFFVLMRISRGQFEQIIEAKWPSQDGNPT